MDREEVGNDADVHARQLVEHRVRDGRAARILQRQLHVPDAHEAFVGHPEHGAPARFDVVDRPQLDVAAAAELLQRLAHAGAAHRLEVHPVAVVADDERLALLVRERARRHDREHEQHVHVAVQPQERLTLLHRADEQEVGFARSVDPLLPRLLGIRQPDADVRVRRPRLAHRVVVAEEDGDVVAVVPLPVVQRRVDTRLTQPVGERDDARLSARALGPRIEHDSHRRED